LDAVPQPDAGGVPIRPASAEGVTIKAAAARNATRVMRPRG
jgi:hypothetical protein